MKQTAVDELLSYFNKDGFNKVITNEIDFMANELVIEKERMYSEEDLKEAFIEGYKQRAEKSDLIFDNASRMYAIRLFKQFKNK